jgi:hypothetical protein
VRRTPRASETSRSSPGRRTGPDGARHGRAHVWRASPDELAAKRRTQRGIAKRTSVRRTERCARRRDPSDTKERVDPGARAAIRARAREPARRGRRSMRSNASRPSGTRRATTGSRVVARFGLTPKERLAAAAAIVRSRRASAGSARNSSRLPSALRPSSVHGVDAVARARRRRDVFDPSGLQRRWRAGAPACARRGTSRARAARRVISAESSVRDSSSAMRDDVGMGALLGETMRGQPFAEDQSIVDGVC